MKNVLRAFKPAKNSLVLKALSLLNREDQQKSLLVVLIQLVLASLDLASVLLIGVIASLSLFGIQSREAPEQVQWLLSQLNLSALPFQTQVAVLGFGVGALLVLKTVISIYISKRTLFFLVKRAAVKSANLLADILEQPFDYIKSKDSTDLLYSLTRGLNSFIVGILGSMMILVTEASLLLVLLVGLIIIDPLITVFSILYFGLISLLQSRHLKKIATLKQGEATSALVESESQILESFQLYRELHVRFARFPLIQTLLETRTKMANYYSEVQFLPYVTKFTMELALVFGAIGLAASQFITKDALSALSVLSIFLAASTRITPSMLRLQQAFIRMKASSIDARRTVLLIEELNELKQKAKSEREFTHNLNGEIKLNNVSFRYKGSDRFVVKNLNLNISSGQFVAIVGPSGHGKSTILDLIIGAVNPTHGSVRIDGVTPADFISQHPGKIGYVPQESSFSNTTVRKSLLLGLEEDSISEETIWETLTRVGLGEFISGLPQKLEEKVGERGSKFSIGQKQRLSLARALLTQPKILVLDEPTSALDSESERLIMNAIYALRESTTIIVVAHRIDTIKNADCVIKVLSGEISESIASASVTGFDHNT